MTTPDRLAELFQQMLEIRLVEEELLRAVQDGRVIGSTHLCIGQEAVPVGACAALESDDPVVATYRGHGWALARGVPAVQLIAEILGRASDLNGGRGGSAYLSGPDYGFFGENSIVGAGVPIALGLALACVRRGTGAIPVVVIGDGAMNQGNVHEALNMASVLGTPLVVVVENNGYVEMTPSDALTAVPAARRAAAYAIPAFEVDGNDPVAVADTVRQARAAAASGPSPVLVEAHTRRLAGHYSGDAQQYRPPGQLEEWRRTDPLALARDRLPAEVVAVREQAAHREVTAAFAAAESMPSPDPEECDDDVYAA